MKFLLDTNVYFAAIHEAGFLDTYGPLLLRIAPRTFLSSVVRFELLQGARGDLGRARVTGATRHLERTGRLVTPSHGDWERAGRIQGALWDENPRLRTKSFQNDILIASSARRIGATVVSENLVDFGTIARYWSHRVLSVAALASALGA